MKKKIIMVAVALIAVLSANAQFEQGKVFVGASLSNIDLSYNGLKKFNIDLNGEGGCFIADDVLVKGIVEYNHSTAKHTADDLVLGIGARYYIEQNGIYLGVNGKYVHNNHSFDDFRPGIEVGYAYFISRTVTIEPAVYYDQSFKNHSDFSTFGVKVGLGIYLFTN